MKQSIKNFLKKMLLKKYDTSINLELSDEDFNYINCDENAMKFLAKLDNMKRQYDEFLSNYYRKSDEAYRLRKFIENSVWVKDHTNEKVLLKLEDVEDYYLTLRRSFHTGTVELCKQELDVDGVRKMTTVYWCATSYDSNKLVAPLEGYVDGAMPISDAIEDYKKLSKAFDELNDWYSE